jgi:hypothetical protein
VLTALQFSPKLLRYLQGHHQRVANVAFSPEGTRLASASWGARVMLLQATSGYSRIPTSPMPSALARIQADKKALYILFFAARPAPTHYCLLTGNQGNYQMNTTLPHGFARCSTPMIICTNCD